MHLRCSLKRPCDFHSSFFSPFPIAFPTFIFLIWWLDKFARFIKKKKREREGELRIKLKFFFLTLRALVFFFSFSFSSLSHCFKSCFFFFCCSCCFGLTFSVFFLPSLLSFFLLLSAKFTAAHTRATCTSPTVQKTRNKRKERQRERRVEEKSTQERESKKKKKKRKRWNAPTRCY